MKYKILTTQPNYYETFLKTGLVARAILKKIITVKIFSLYDYTTDKHRSIDDTPYGGGAGMVLRVDVMDKAISKIKNKRTKIKTILLTPQGKRFTQADARRLAKEKEILLISGRFEGYDERIRDLVDEEISIGDFVLTAGDLPAMVLIDVISRQLPGFLEEKGSLETESFDEDLLEYPQYTRPEKYKGETVPEILLSGNHGEIAKWRNNIAIERTEARVDK